VGLEGILNPLGVQISLFFSGELRDDFDHSLDHVARVHASTRAPDEPRDHFSDGGGLGKVDPVIEPTEGILRHRLVKPCEISSRIDGLHLNSEGLSSCCIASAIASMAYRPLLSESAWAWKAVRPACNCSSRAISLIGLEECSGTREINFREGGYPFECTPATMEPHNPERQGGARGCHKAISMAVTG
jgi:hypothetical protein